MALLDIVKKGAVDRSVPLRIVDSGDGTPETGVVFNTTGIDLWYRRELSAKVSITEATLAALTTAHADGGFLHIGDGEYRLDLPDAAFAAGANHVDIGGTVTGMVVIGGRVRLVDYDPEDVVRLGLTALPNAVADAAGGLPISDAGGLDMDAILSRIGSPSNLGGGASLAFNLSDIEGQTDDWVDGGRLDLLIDAIKVVTDALPNGGALTSLSGLVDDLETRLTAARAGYLDSLNGNFAQTGDSFARIGAAGASLTGLGGMSVGMKAEVQQEATDALIAYDPPTNAEMEARTIAAAAYFDPATDTVAAVTAVGSVTGAVGSVSGAVGSVAGNVVGSVGSLGATAQTNVQTAAAAALTAYDPPTATELASAAALLATAAAATAIEADTQNIQSRIPAALTGAGNIKADVLAINGATLEGDGSLATPWGPA